MDHGRHEEGRDELDHHTGLSVARGKLIVFEGAEGAGKTTQIRLLAERLGAKGVAAVAVREPGGTPVGDAIREILLDPEQQITTATEALLFMASRAELIAREIRPALDAGDVVLLDRFFLSTYAYQIVGRGLPEDEVRAANRLATNSLVPDLTLLLDVPASKGLERADARGKRDRIERSADDFHQRVGDAFRKFVEPAWQRSHPECGPIKLIDGSGDETTVLSRVVSALASAFPQPFSSIQS
ncbi:MAG TPA: dTMP kinase [Gemmatimonadaceae bacterium]|nr:dTMP kinase [Gemmatimonadaceae bacterium]